MGGLTNHTYQVTLENGETYVFRIPGEGTEEMINRNDEKVSTELACQLGIDAELLYFGKNGEKITKYISNAITMSPDTMKQDELIIKAAKVFKTLHTCNVDTGVPFEMFDMASNYEKIVFSNNISMYDDYLEIKSKVMKIKEMMDKKGKSKLVPCHNDPLCENWIIGDDKLYLIDWEYAGMNDGMWDLADVSIEAGYNDMQDELFLKIYLGHSASKEDKMLFLANKLYLDYLWTLWGKTRVPFDGESMELYALERYKRLKENLKKFEGHN